MATLYKADPEALLPLTPAVFSIMMALADGEKHGYAIMQTVEAETDGAVRMGPGTLYGSLDRMLRAKLVTESEGTDDSAPHRKRRRYYRLTELGSHVLRAEIERLRRAIVLARRKRLTSSRSLTPL
ncbi:MAG: PadR family transcriptional regulator [Limisphaerales bacterium]